MKVGDYAYIKNNREYGIGKIHVLLENNNVLVLFKDFIKRFSVGNVISSDSPIDLIEVGDYVNGVRVDEIISNDDKEICFKYKYAINEDDVYTLRIEDVKSIVTKEQFENMQYIL